MAEFTQNYSLRKDSQDDFYDVDVFNNNFDIIDQNMKQIEIESKNKDGGNADTLEGKHANDFIEYKIFDNLDEVFETYYEGAFKIKDSSKWGFSFKLNEYDRDDYNRVYIFIRFYGINDDIYIRYSECRKEVRPDKDYYFWTQGEEQILSKAGHTHDFPNSLKNPNPLILQFNKTIQKTYDGSKTEILNITPKGINAAVCMTVSDGDFNDITEPGIYTMQHDIDNEEGQVLNSPSSDYTGLIVLNSFNGMVQQIAFEENSYNVYIRTKDISNGWTEWKKINDGGNADTLEGKHADYFAAASHVHDNAKTDTSGFLSAEDKIKLNGIAEGANKTIIDNTLNNTSVNPVQNKVINTALSGKANKEHTHTINQITNLPESFPANGGNADTVDNKHASDFINTFNITSNVNWNTLTNTGIYNIKTTGGTNNPASHHGALYVNNTVGTPFQMFIPDGDTEYIFKRRLTGEWKKLYLNCSEIGYRKTVPFSVKSGNWYRVIHGAGACGGVFTINIRVGAYSNVTVFSSSQMNSDTSSNNIIQILSHSAYNGGVISKIRQVRKYMASEQYIDFYISKDSESDIDLNVIFTGTGWNIYDDIETANVADGYEIKEITL